MYHYKNWYRYGYAPAGTVTPGCSGLSKVINQYNELNPGANWNCVKIKILAHDVTAWDDNYTFVATVLFQIQISIQKDR